MADHIANRINAHLAALSDKPVTVAWDGAIITREEPAAFHVYADGEETNYVVIDHPRGLALHFDNGRFGFFDEVDTVATYDQLAKLLLEEVTVPEGEDA